MNTGAAYWLNFSPSLQLIARRRPDAGLNASTGPTIGLDKSQLSKHAAADSVPAGSTLHLLPRLTDRNRPKVDFDCRLESGHSPDLTCEVTGVLAASPRQPS